MTVRQLVRRVWLAALVGTSAAVAASAQSPDPSALPPLPGSKPIVPAAGTLVPAVPVAPTIPPPAVVPVVPPVTTPAVPPMMSPMPTAAPQLPPMDPPSVKPLEVAPTAKLVEPPPVTRPVEPMPPATPPVFEPAATAKPAAPPPKSHTDVKVGKPAVDGVAAYSMALAEAKLAYGKVADYSGHVIHQDRVKGKLTPDQTAEIRVKTKPSSVSLKYVAPSGLTGQELVYVSGRNAGKLRLKPAGSFGPGGFLSVDLHDSRATAHTRHTAVEFGIGPMIEMLEKQLMIENRLRNAVQVSVADYAYAGRPVTRYEVFTDRAHALRQAYRTVVYVDKETKLPIRMEAYDQPTAGGSPTGDLLEAYSYVNLKFNQGLGDIVFEK